MTPAWFVDQDLVFARMEMERMKTRLMPEHIHGIGHKQNGCRECPRGGTPDLEWIPKLKPHWWVLSANIDIWRRHEDERPALLRAGNHAAFFHFQRGWTGRRRLGLVLSSLDRLAELFGRATSQQIVHVKSSGWETLRDGQPPAS